MKNCYKVLRGSIIIPNGVKNFIETNPKEHAKNAIIYGFILHKIEHSREYFKITIMIYDNDSLFIHPFITTDEEEMYCAVEYCDRLGFYWDLDEKEFKKAKMFCKRNEFDEKITSTEKHDESVYKEIETIISGLNRGTNSYMNKESLELFCDLKRIFEFNVKK